MDPFKQKIYSIPQFQELVKISKKENVHLKNVHGSLISYVADFVSKELAVPVLYIANSLESAEKNHDDLEFINSSHHLAFLPGLYLEPYETTDPRPELVSMRLEAMQTFLENDEWIAVCTFESLLEKLPLQVILL